MNRVWLALLPELEHVPDGERASALHAAREAPLEALELIGMAVGLVVVTALTKVVVGEAVFLSRLGGAMLNFAVALPMLVAVLGPFHVRRLRRGLRLRHRRGERS